MSQRITARASSAICTVRCFVSIGLFTASRKLSDSLPLWYLQGLPAGMREELLPLLPTLFDDPLRASPCAVMDSTRFCPSYGIFFIYGVYGTRHFHTVSGASFDVWHIGLYIPLFASALWASWQEATSASKSMRAVTITMFVLPVKSDACSHLCAARFIVVTVQIISTMLVTWAFCLPNINLKLSLQARSAFADVYIALRP
jgi:hypothetical protein